MKLQNIIDELMENDKNATWYECINTKEIAEALTEALNEYEKTEETYIFYSNNLNKIQRR